ncbi:MAG TPA: hypothetical protein VMS17_30020, partial [Gemmataceae bacterium]|nr:hypothetical protein [Gemmataceae bacterium]
MQLRVWIGFGTALAACVGAASSWPPPLNDADADLVQNPSFAKAGDDPKLPAHFSIKGDAEWVTIGGKYECAPHGVAFYPWVDLDNDGR